MSAKISRRRIITTGLASVAGVGGLAAAAKIADHYGLLAPDYQGLFGAGEALTYGAQRLLTPITPWPANSIAAKCPGLLPSITPTRTTTSTKGC